MMLANAYSVNMLTRNRLSANQNCAGRILESAFAVEYLEKIAYDKSVGHTTSGDHLNPEMGQ